MYNVCCALKYYVSWWYTTSALPATDDLYLNLDMFLDYIFLILYSCQILFLLFSIVCSIRNIGESDIMQEFLSTESDEVGEYPLQWLFPLAACGKIEIIGFWVELP